MRALIVDDSAVMRKVIERALGQAGLELTMDGLQFLETRRQENLAQGVPVVMITTEGNEAFVLRAIAAGAQGYICKPFTAEQVKVRVLPLLRAA